MPGPLGRRARTTVGRMRHRLRVEAPLEALDEFRVPRQTWLPEGDPVLAEVVLDGGDEFARGGGTQAKVTGWVTMRPLAGLTPKKRLVWLRGDGTELVLNVVACPPAEGASNFVRVRVAAEA